MAYKPGGKQKSDSGGNWQPPQASSKRWLLPVVVGAVALVAVGIFLATRPGAPAPSNGLPQGTRLLVENDHTHVLATNVHYNANPPAGGPHSAAWLKCGIYATPVPNVNAVHSMEHGTVWITYRPDLASSQVQTLRALATSLYDGPERYLIVSPYPGLPAPIVASTWGAQIRITTVSDPRLVEFIRHFIGGNQGGEQGASCFSGGVGQPIG